MGKARVPGGYVDLPRHLYDAALAAPGLSGAGLRVVLVILRLTWGYYPEKHRDGARISHKVIAKRAGISLSRVRGLLPALTREGIIEQVTPPTGRRAATVRVNPDPLKWGRFVPVEYPALGTLEAASPSEPVEYPPLGTQSNRGQVPRVLAGRHSTASPVLPSLERLSLEGDDNSAAALSSPCDPVLDRGPSCALCNRELSADEIYDLCVYGPKGLQHARCPSMNGKGATT